jgi:hypothetical protein
VNRYFGQIAQRVTADQSMYQAMHERRSRLVPALAAIVVALGWATAGSAGAAITPFTLAPVSGPAGTVVAVSGAGCSPGLTVSAAGDYVLVTAPTLQVSTHATVAANGSWHGSFTVPAGALPAGAPVAALCVSDGLPSLLTLYTPQTFTVTAPPTTTASTTTTTTGTTHPTTPTTKPRESGGTIPTPPPTNGGTQPPHGGEGPGATLPISGGTPPGGGGSTGGSPNGGSAPGGSSTSRPGKVDVEHATRAAARAADLSAPELPAADVGGSGGLGWLAWLLLLSLAGAAVATPLWIRRYRRTVAEGGDLGDAA